jgi:hypothetical protein
MTENSAAATATPRKRVNKGMSFLRCRILASERIRHHLSVAGWRDPCPGSAPLASYRRNMAAWLAAF